MFNCTKLAAKVDGLGCFLLHNKLILGYVSDRQMRNSESMVGLDRYSVFIFIKVETVVSFCTCR